MRDSEYILPYVAVRDYEAFFSLMEDEVPGTHPEWVQFMNKRRLEEEQRGMTVKFVDVNPDEFTRYCGATGQRHNYAALTRFVIEKAGGNRY
jgi:hypothetical protein